MRKYGKVLNTQKVLYPFIGLGQCFALFPVTGINGSDLRTARFSWRSKLTMYSLVYLTFSTVNLCLYFIKQINSKEFLSPFVGFVHFIVVLLVELFFIGLARKWPALVEKWTEVDLSMANLYTPSHVLGYKLKTTTLFIMTCAFCEHGLFVASKFSVLIYNNNNRTNTDIIKTYLKTSYDQVFAIIPYNLFIGIFIQIFNIYCTFAWNYKDLFIILISIVLSERYVQILNKIKLMAKYKITQEYHWRSIREDYIRLTRVCKLINQVMANIVILSFTHNLFVVLIQFMFTLHQQDQTLIERFYFIYSFGFLIVRIICVCLFAAEIDHVSKKPLRILTTLPSKVYNIEIERFILQIATNSAHLSGGEFFVITRSLVLSISGAIVTYELVLIQMYNFRYNK